MQKQLTPYHHRLVICRRLMLYRANRVMAGQRRKNNFNPELLSLSAYIPAAS